jgi:hypothetical protein
MIVEEIVSHPFFLLLVGALISGLLIPYFTRRWQNHQKELEIKTNLVGRISESIMSMIMTNQFIEIGIKNIKLLFIDIVKRELDPDASHHRPEDTEFVRGEITNLRKSVDEIEMSLGELNMEYKRFVISTAVIGTIIQTYFLEANIGKEWDNFIDKITVLCSDT